MFFRQPQLHRRGRESLRQCIVNLAGDTVALGENGGEFRLGHRAAMRLLVEPPARNGQSSVSVIPSATNWIRVSIASIVTRSFWKSNAWLKLVSATGAPLATSIGATGVSL